MRELTQLRVYLGQLALSFIALYLPLFFLQPTAKGYRFPIPAVVEEMNVSQQHFTQKQAINQINCKSES